MNLRRGFFRIWIIVTLGCIAATIVTAFKAVDIHYVALSYALGSPSEDNHEAIRKQYYPHLSPSIFKLEIVDKFPKIDMSQEFPWLGAKKGPPELLPSFMQILLEEHIIWILPVGILIIPLLIFIIARIFIWLVEGFKNDKVASKIE